jgi:hypothetical protein
VERTTEEMLKSGDGGRLDAAVLLVVLPWMLVSYSSTEEVLQSQDK